MIRFTFSSTLPVLAILFGSAVAQAQTQPALPPLLPPSALGRPTIRQIPPPVAPGSAVPAARPAPVPQQAAPPQAPPAPHTPPHQAPPRLPPPKPSRPHAAVRPSRPTPVVQADKAPHAQRPNPKPAEHKPPPAAPAPPPTPAPAPNAPAGEVAPADRGTDAPKGSETGRPLPRFAALHSDEVNLRTGPGTRYPIDWVYRRRDLPVEIEREFEVWRLVSDPDGVKGWVHQATLTGRRSFIVRGAEATMRRSADPAAAAVAVLKPGVVGRLRACDAKADWCEVQVGDYRGFLPRAAFWGTYAGEAVN